MLSLPELSPRDARALAFVEEYGEKIVEVEDGDVYGIPGLNGHDRRRRTMMVRRGGDHRPSLGADRAALAAGK